MTATAVRREVIAHRGIEYLAEAATLDRWGMLRFHDGSQQSLHRVRIDPADLFGIFNPALFALTEVLQQDHVPQDVTVLVRNGDEVAGLAGSEEDPAVALICQDTDFPVITQIINNTLKVAHQLRTSHAAGDEAAVIESYVNALDLRSVYLPGLISVVPQLLRDTLHTH